VVVSKRGAVEALNDAVDPDERAGEGIGLGEADRELVGMWWYLAGDGEGPDRLL
jgi:hypothetical protein